MNELKSSSGSLLGAAPPVVPVGGDEDGLRAAHAHRIGHERRQSQTGAAQQRVCPLGRLLPLRFKHVRPGSGCSHLEVTIMKEHVSEEAAAAAAAQVTFCSDSPGKSTCKRWRSRTGASAGSTEKPVKATSHQRLLVPTEQQGYISPQDQNRDSETSLSLIKVIQGAGGEKKRPRKVSVQVEHLPEGKHQSSRATSKKLDHQSAPSAITINGLTDLNSLILGSDSYLSLTCFRWNGRNNFMDSPVLG